jgi:uncharacterized radical SAM superfamily Fe-S cluster-containing enzyme
LSHLAHDVKRQTGIGEPARDWFPISFMSTFTDWTDLIKGPQAEWGQVTCGCHPNCGTGMAVMIDRTTKEAVPLTAFLRPLQFARDVAAVNDAARGRVLSIVGMLLALTRNYDPFKAPAHLTLAALMRKFSKKLVGRRVPLDRGVDVVRGRAERWHILFVAGMWFQDLFNYDFRRTEMCIIPYATQQGEISFCAYNTGVGWRRIVEKMHLTASVATWHAEHGRHPIYAAGKRVPLESVDHSLELDPEALRAPAQADAHPRGVPRTAREERKQARHGRL